MPLGYSSTLQHSRLRSARMTSACPDDVHRGGYLEIRVGRQISTGQLNLNGHPHTTGEEKTPELWPTRWLPNLLRVLVKHTFQLGAGGGMTW